jgi:hypothetical protein
MKVPLLDILSIAPRIDRLYLDKLGNFVYVEGVPDRSPKAPEKVGDVMLLATFLEIPHICMILNSHYHRCRQ